MAIAVFLYVFKVPGRLAIDDINEITTWSMAGK